MTSSEHIPLSAIKFDSGTQIRSEINAESLVEYADLMREGVVFPPVELFRDGDLYYIGDGWHRLLAAQKNGDVTFPANVLPGGRRDAVKFALSANARHGMPRTNADKRKAVEVALRELGNLSNREIALICAVSDKTVSAVRASSGAEIPHVEKRLGGDGKIYTVPARKEPEAAPYVPPAPAPQMAGHSIKQFESDLGVLLDSIPNEHLGQAEDQLLAAAHTIHKRIISANRAAAERDVTGVPGLRERLSIMTEGAKQSGAESDKDSEKLWRSKSSWRKMSRRDKTAFKAWVAAGEGVSP